MERRSHAKGALASAGTTAINIDVSDKLAAALPGFIAFIVGLAIILQLLVFRSAPVPITAVLGFLFTIAASMGAVVWIFQEGHLAGLLGMAREGPVLSFLPGADDCGSVRPGDGLPGVPRHPRP